MKRTAAFLVALLAALAIHAADKSIVLVAGTPSHGKAEHEFRAGCLLLADCLNKVPGIHATASLSGAWPAAAAFEKADAIFIY